MFRPDQYMLSSQLVDWRAKFRIVLVCRLACNVKFVFDNFRKKAQKKKYHLKQNTFPDHNMDYVTSIFTEFVSGLIQSIVTLFVIIIVVVKIQGKEKIRIKTSWEKNKAKMD